jgi:hypothetical protein
MSAEYEGLTVKVVFFMRGFKNFLRIKTRRGNHYISSI